MIIILIHWIFIVEQETRRNIPIFSPTKMNHHHQVVNGIFLSHLSKKLHLLQPVSVVSFEMQYYQLIWFYHWESNDQSLPQHPNQETQVRNKCQWSSIFAHRSTTTNSTTRATNSNNTSVHIMECTRDIQNIPW